MKYLCCVYYSKVVDIHIIYGWKYRGWYSIQRKICRFGICFIFSKREGAICSFISPYNVFEVHFPKVTFEMATIHLTELLFIFYSNKNYLYPTTEAILL